MRQPFQGDANRRPRRPQQGDQPQFRQPLSSDELAVEDPISQVNDEAIGLTVETRCCMERRPSLHAKIGSGDRLVNYLGPRILGVSQQ